MTRTRDQILTDVLALLNSVAQDWEFEGTVSEGTHLFADLAFESLDLVILGAKVQEHFGQTFPFPELFADMGRRGARDLTVGEWVDFIEKHQKPASGAEAGAAAASERA